MQVLADENIQRVTVWFLREQGWDILWAGDENLAGVDDARFFERAQERQRILLTYNVHFADLRKLTAHPHHGIIRLRFTNQRVDFVHPRLCAAPGRREQW